MIIDLALLKATLPAWYEPVFHDQIEIVAKMHELDPILVASIIAVESGFMPFTARYEEGFKYIRADYRDLARISRVTDETEKTLEKMSIGLMQIMGATARDLGFRGNLAKLFDWQTNLTWGCSYLAKLHKRHTNPESVISAYNAGTPRKIGGKFTNQEYVDRVLIKYRELKEKKTTP